MALWLGELFVSLIHHYSQCQMSGLKPSLSEHILWGSMSLWLIDVCPISESGSQTPLWLEEIICECDSLLFTVSDVGSQTLPDWEYLWSAWVSDSLVCIQYQIVGRKPPLIGRNICECDSLLSTVSDVGSQTLPDWDYLCGEWVYDSLVYIQYQLVGRKPSLIGFSQCYLSLFIISVWIFSVASVRWYCLRLCAEKNMLIFILKPLILCDRKMLLVWVCGWKNIMCFLGICKHSHAGNRTRAFWVKPRCPNH